MPFLYTLFEENNIIVFHSMTTAIVQFGKIEFPHDFNYLKFVQQFRK
jgi:hypothetical protein